MNDGWADCHSDTFVCARCAAAARANAAKTEESSSDQFWASQTRMIPSHRVCASSTENKFARSRPPGICRPTRIAPATDEQFFPLSRRKRATVLDITTVVRPNYTDLQSTLITSRCRRFSLVKKRSASSRLRAQTRSFHAAKGDAKIPHEPHSPHGAEWICFLARWARLSLVQTLEARPIRVVG